MTQRKHAASYVEKARLFQADLALGEASRSVTRVSMILFGLATAYVGISYLSKRR